MFDFTCVGEKRLEKSCAETVPSQERLHQRKTSLVPANLNVPFPTSAVHRGVDWTLLTALLTRTPVAATREVCTPIAAHTLAMDSPT